MKLNSKFKIQNSKWGLPSTTFKIKSSIRWKESSRLISVTSNRIKSGAGVTLIELLIGVAIISILSTLLMVNFIAVRQRGRDAERKSNLRQVQSALELYRADQDDYTLTLANCGSGASLGSPTCSTIYMNKLPKDPNGSSYYNGGSYYYTSDGIAYSLVACIENISDKDSNITQAPPAGAPTDCSSGYYYVLQNP